MPFFSGQLGVAQAHEKLREKGASKANINDAQGERTASHKSRQIGLGCNIEAAADIDRPPTLDDVTIALDGRRIDSKEKAIAWLAEIEAHRAAGKTAADTLA
jgi:hypothetical protein